MEDNSLLALIRQVKDAFLQSGTLERALEGGVKEISAMTGSAAFVVENSGRVLAGYQGDVEADSHVAHLVEQGTAAGDSALEEMIGSDQPLFNGTTPAGAGGEQVEQTTVAEKSLLYTVIPIKSGPKFLGALILYHPGNYLDEKQVLAAEMVSALSGLVLMQATAGQEEEDTRNRELATGAFESLSYSEVEAIREILKNIDNNESIVVASKIADNLGITRSVIVNALRKFESAGIIESRSLGMKGTLIRVKNEHALELVATRSENMDSIR